MYNEGQTITTESTEPYKLGSVNAKWNLGWRNGFTYKGFNLNFLVTARLGGIVVSKTQAVLDQFGVSQARPMPVMPEKSWWAMWQFSQKTIMNRW